MTQPTSIIEAFRNLLGVDTPNIDNLIARLSYGNVKGKEGPLLEFKASYVPMPGDKDTPDACRWNVIEAIVGMANSQGGCVVLGLAEDKETKELERGNGDPDNVLGKVGREDKDLAEHTRKALFKGDAFKISDHEMVKVGQDFWEQLESQTNGTKGFVTCRSHVGGDANGFPVVAIFVEPIPVDNLLLDVEIVKKETTYTEHSRVFPIRSGKEAKTTLLVHSKWKTEQTRTSKTGNVITIEKGRIDDPDNKAHEEKYMTFLRTRNPQWALKALSEKINNLESTSGKPVFSFVNPPQVANFVGRDKELEELHRLLSEGRIPVVTGPGGTGKTELVLQYAERHKADYPGGLFQIDMEGLSDWEQAFRSMLYRTGVQQALGILENRCVEKKQDFYEESFCTAGMREEADGETVASPSGALEEDSVRKTESIMDILFDRARREGKVLLVLDNVEPSACKSLFKEQVLSRLSIPPEVRIVATTRALDLTFPPKGRRYEFRLHDLSPDKAVKLLLSDHPTESEADQKAAENIAKILGFRILYLKAIPSLLEDDDSIFAGSYRVLEKELRRDLAGVIAAGMEGDEKRTPPALWQMTKRAFAANTENGKRWILLAWIASLFSSNLGVRKEVLSALWKRIAAPNGDPEIAFSQAVNKLLKHGALEERDGGFGMHRLTRMAVRRSAWEESRGLGAEVGLALAESGISKRADWVSLAGCLPALDSIPAPMLDGMTCVRILLRNPRFADRCPWEKLYGDAWAWLLGAQPQFADRCLWEKLYGEDWVNLLVKQPAFADRCPWEKLHGYHLADLFEAQPQLAEKCLWERLGGFAWALLLGRQPQLADKCSWEKLDGDAWAWLLEAQPQFSDRCPWEKLDGKAWAQLLGRQPQFADRCPWEKLDNSKSLRQKLLHMSRYRRPGKKLDGICWADLLGKQPQFANRCPWDKLEGGAWAWLLGRQPQFADKCPWDKLDDDAWAWLLERQSQFAAHCPPAILRKLQEKKDGKTASATEGPHRHV